MRKMLKASLPLLVFTLPSLACAQPPGGPGGKEVKLVEQFDQDQNGWLNVEERAEAREYLNENPIARGGPGGGPRGPGGFGGPGGPGGFGGPGRGGPGGRFGPPDGEPGFGEEGFPPPGFIPPEGGFGLPPGAGFGPPGGRRGGPPGGMGGNRPEAKPGKSIAKSSVQPLTGELYDASVLRTVFIDFASEDWEAELEQFHGTDVDVEATITVGGKEYPNCGIHFRGMSSYFMIPTGYKRSLNVSMDMADSEQKLLGYQTLNLLNCSGDASMLSSVLYSHIARKYTTAPKVNFVRVVINGENWGIYSNAQQFNKTLLKENYGSGKGARWKVSGSPRGQGGLEYLGEDVSEYESRYEMKSGKDEAWSKLIHFCRVLNETPIEELPVALEPICDVDELLWFLALDNALINSDGYWIRASDYSLYLDKDDRMHFIPHDMNEGFRQAGGPGGPGGRRGPGGGMRGGRPGEDERGGERGDERGGERGRGGRGVGEATPRDLAGEPPRGGPGLGAPGGRGRGFGGPGFGGPGFGGPGFGGPGFGGPGFGGPGAAGPGFAGPGAGGPGAGGGLELDPLIGLDDPSKPLRSRVLAVDSYRQQYLQNVRQIAEESLDWKELAPFVKSQVALIRNEVKADTRKLSTFEEFISLNSERDATASATEESPGHGPGHGAMNLREFAEGRRTYLLKATEGISRADEE